MAASRVSVFLDALRASQILEPPQIDQMVAAVKLTTDDPVPLAREFIQRNLLTPFQVNYLVRGAAKDLMVGPYRLLDRLGEGGMGQVFKAFHVTMNRVVALKVIRPDRLSNPIAVRRFNQEVRTAAQLQHPNIVMSFDAGQVENNHFIAMEYVEGTDLLKTVKQFGPLPVSQACEYIRQAASGLAHGHERGMVHRDIKPSNMLVPKTQGPQNPGVLKILDMGLARLQAPGDEPAANGLTRVGTVLGSPEYLAPEQAVNSSGVDIRADLYSLGCTFYFLLAGQTPFTGKTANDLMMKHFSDQAAPLDDFRNDVPPAIQAIVKKLMSKKPVDRYQTPAELLAVLTPFCGRQVAPIQAAMRQPTMPMPVGIVTKTQPGKASNGPLIVRKPMRKSGGSWKAVVIGVFGMLFLAGAGISAVLLYPKINGGASSEPLAEAKPVAVAKPKVAAPTEAGTKAPEPEAKVEPEAKKEPVAKTEPKTEPVVKADPPTKGDPKTKVDPKPKVEPKPEPKVEVKPKVEPKAKPQKPPVPEAGKLAAAEKNIRELYKTEYARKKSEDMTTLAGKLMADAAGTKDDASLRFALLTEARDLAAVAGSLDGSMKAIDELEKNYAVDALDMKVIALEKASKATNVPPAMRAIVDVALKVKEEAIDADNYEAARRAVAAALTAARKSNSATTVTRVQAEEKEVADISKEFLSAKAARDKLSAGADEESSFKWGKFISYFKGHWGDGLPLLAGGSDDKVGSLAVKDQANPNDPAQQVEVGDGWFTLGETDKSMLARKNLWVRAKVWYDQALPNLTGFAKSKVEKRLKEIDALLPKDDASGSTGTASVPTMKPKSEFDVAMQSGAALYRAGKYADAAEAYKKAVGLNPDSTKAAAALKQTLYAEAIARGTLLATQGNYADAATEFRKALDEVPNDPTASRYLSLAMGGNGNGNGNNSPFMRRGKRP